VTSNLHNDDLGHTRAADSELRFGANHGITNREHWRDDTQGSSSRGSP
jgi:hypothetical protein